MKYSLNLSKFLSNNVKLLYSVTLVFLYIFSFSLPVIKTSTILSFGLALLSVYIVKYRDIKSLYSSRLIFFNTLSLLFLLFLSFFITFIHAQYDYAISKLIPTQIIYIFIGGFIAIAIFNVNGRCKNIQTYTKIVAYAFCLQSIIMILATMSPFVLSFVRLFQPDSVSIISDRYSGFRGVALASGQFFSLSVTYGLTIIMFCIYNLKNDTRLKNIVVTILLSIGVLYAGRTAFISFLILLPFFVSFRFSLTLVASLKTIFMLFIAGFLVYFLFPTVSKVIVDNVFSYAFEFIYNYIDYGTLTTSSTDKLHDMYFPIEYGTFLFGDGRFSGINSAYYMGTDAGYMRTVLFGGVFFSIILVLIQITYYSKKDMFFYASIIYILLVNYKGVSTVLLLSIQCLLMLVAFFNFLCRSDDKHK
ncbi:hypothetical protein [Vibrio splendidus]|uniref:hypothetical protein n=1 Tax=Vibrio splendidus TaxID=29497 RepID=UPI000D3B8000|nr:hypothetical protein [Vibrio splendidus]PTP92709.1 hypothetical protein CWO02_12440 [Vibrio splendidus]